MGSYWRQRAEKGRKMTKLEKRKPRGIQVFVSFCRTWASARVSHGVSHRIIAFMANKRKDVPVMLERWSNSATTLSPSVSGLRSILKPSSPVPRPLIPSPATTTIAPLLPSSRSFGHRRCRAIGLVFAENIVQGLPDPVNRSATLWDTLRTTKNIILGISSKSPENKETFIRKQAVKYSRFIYYLILPKSTTISNVIS